MLVLSRKTNERILIGDGIRITVLSIRGNQVRLGIEAPGEVRVVREELTHLPPGLGWDDAPAPDASAGASRAPLARAFDRSRG